MMSCLQTVLHAREYKPGVSGWCEYYFLSLMERTRRFASDYCELYRATFGGSLSFNFEPSSPEFATLWKMRHSADVWGVSYPLYLEVCFHLYRNPKYAEHLAFPSLRFKSREDSRTWRRRFAKIWEERQYAEYARLVHMPQFWLENDRGLPAQEACRRRLVNLAATGRRYLYVAETFSVENRIVPVARILNTIADIGERKNVASAIRSNVTSSRTVIGQAPASESGDLLQTCFGLPRKLEGSTDPCSTCVHQSACALAADLLNRES